MKPYNTAFAVLKGFFVFNCALSHWYKEVLVVEACKQLRKDYDHFLACDSPQNHQHGNYFAPKISIKEISKIFPGKEQDFVAIKKVSLSVSPNEFVSIVGPSGCGKSTLLKMIAGLEESTEGKIWVSGKEVNGPGADRGMVFQTYTLFPWLTVADNIVFGLKLKGEQTAECKKIVDKYLELIKLTEFGHCYPKELSGGMKQRVAIARALANNPSVLLMDEPFGALDPQTKGVMQELLLDIWRKEKTTIIFITHDIEEAIFLSQRVYVMQKAPGRIVQMFDIPLPVERTSEIKDTEQFIGIKKQIVKLLKD